MKPILMFLPTLAVSALASTIHLTNNNDNHVEALLGRAIDPATMDPTRLSVLSVLKTAMPTDPAAPMPTGAFEPEWYAKLPEDVKTLLPSLYPVADVSVAAAGVSSVSTSEVVSTSVPITLSSATPMPTSSSSSLSTSTADAVNSTSLSSLATVTKPLQYATTGTGLPLSTGAPNKASTNATGTLPTASPTPSDFFSAGAKNAIKTEMMAAVSWVVLGVGFFLFA